MGASVANYSKGISQTLGNQTPNPLCVTTHTHMSVKVLSNHTHMQTHTICTASPLSH